MTTTQQLPTDFADLEDLVEEWALDTMAARNAVRLQCTMEELDAFYQRMVDRMPAIMSHLQKMPTESSLSPADGRLYNLACAYMEVVPAVELFRSPDVPDAFPAERFLILD